MDALAVLFFALTFVGLAGAVGVKLRPKAPGLLEQEERVFSEKLASIEQGERNATGALARIAAARTTPDRQRARALELLAERADDDVLGDVLSAVLRSCEAESRRAVFALAARFPDPETLETAALETLEGTRNEDLGIAALEAIAVAGGPRSLSALRKRPWHSPRLRPTAEDTLRILESRLPVDQEGALSDPEHRAGAMSLER